jgi:tRNA nucleotidyltransferase (CCA-adding enzyme)
MKIYLVGGAVRDKLLGIPVKDRDWLVVGSSVEEMLALDYQQVGKDFPVFLHPVTKEEYALARTERKSGKGYTGFKVYADKSVTLEEDLLRRDLTINAMAEDEDGKLVDPLNGRQDLENKILRHVSDAFTEDPLRVLRVARFAARFHHLGFTIADETMQLMQELSSGEELDHLINERIWTETGNALQEKSPQVYIQVLENCKALVKILPEVANLFGVAQPAKYHPEIDTGIHTLMVLEQAALLSTDAVVRFAALMHDVGKGAIPEQQRPNFQGHEQLGVELINTACKRIKAPNEHRDLAKMTSLYHTRCHRADRHGAEEIFETLELTDAWRKPERFAQFLLACEADSRGRLGLEDTPYPQANLLAKALEASNKVDTRQIVEAGYKDADIGEQVRIKRLQLITAHLNQ